MQLLIFLQTAKLNMSKSDCVLLSITGCEDILPPEFGTFVYEMDEAIAKFECPGRQLVGQSVLGCDGQYWNGTEPFCVALTTTTTTTMRSHFFLSQTLF